MVTNAMRSNNEGLPKQAKKCAGKRQKLVEVGPFQIAARRNGGMREQGMRKLTTSTLAARVRLR